MNVLGLGHPVLKIPVWDYLRALATTGKSERGEITEEFPLLPIRTPRRTQAKHAPLSFCNLGDSFRYP